MDILMTTIDVPAIPFVALMWFLGFIFWKVGRCSAMNDILDAGGENPLPEDLEFFRKTWVTKKIQERLEQKSRK